jgi:hypothetical protein
MSQCARSSKTMPFSMRFLVRRQRPRVQRTRFLPGLDPMEERTLLSPLTVLNNHDSGSGSLRAAIAAAKSGDTIDFANSVHNITLTSGELNVITNLNIAGPGAGLLDISGDNASRVLEIGSNATVTIGGLTIANGQAAGRNGGGVLVDAGASLVLDHVVVTHNSASADSLGNFGSGGGIENDGSLTVTASLFTNNLASGGSNTDPITEGSAGGAVDSQGTSLTVTGSAFAGNHAVGPAMGTGEGNGGAINNNSTATITGSTFSGNSALGRTANGGAIATGENELITAPPMAISNCMFTANQAVGADGTDDFTAEFGGQALGGAIDSVAPLSITASTFTGNLAKGGDGGNNASGITDGDTNGFVGLASGGGVLNEFGSLVVSDSLFVGNQAVGGNSATGVGGLAAGGGILNAGFSSATLTDVTLLGNQAIGGMGGPGSSGGSSAGGGFYNGVDAIAAVSDTRFVGNLAKGGAGGSGATGGAGAGGAIANGGGFGDLVLSSHDLGADTSVLTLDQSMLSLNVAQGGGGSDGGDGSGGGFYADPATTASIDATAIVANAALGGIPGTGGAVGQGAGGGICIGSGAAVTLSMTDDIVLNFASSSDDDIFGS